MSDFKNELEQEVEFINDLISRYLPDETGLDKKIREAMNYSVNAGGKRVRPMLMLEVYKPVSYTHLTLPTNSLV